jgi:hypothetical protein
LISNWGGNERKKGHDRVLVDIGEERERENK